MAQLGTEDGAAGNWGWRSWELGMAQLGTEDGAAGRCCSEKSTGIYCHNVLAGGGHVQKGEIHSSLESRIWCSWQVLGTFVL